MAKKLRKPKIDNHRYEIGAAQRLPKKNGFNYREVIGQKDINVIEMGRGYDTYGQALRACRRARFKRKEEFQYRIYHRGELIE